MGSICPVLKWLGCPVFKWHSKTIPFGMQPFYNHLNTRPDHLKSDFLKIWISNDYRFWMVGFQGQNAESLAWSSSSMCIALVFPSKIWSMILSKNSAYHPRSPLYHPICWSNCISRHHCTCVVDDSLCRRISGWGAIGMISTLSLITQKLISFSGAWRSSRTWSSRHWNGCGRTELQCSSESKNNNFDFKRYF